MQNPSFTIVLVSVAVGLTVGGMTLLKQRAPDRPTGSRMDQLELVVANNEATPRELFDYAYELHGAGRLEEALPAHLIASEDPRFRDLGLYNAACAASLLGDHNLAMHYLLLSISEGYRDLTHMSRDPDLDPLRERADFKAIMHALKLLHEPDFGKSLDLSESEH